MQQIENSEIERRNCLFCTEEDYQICKSNLETCPRVIKLPEGICETARDNYTEKHLGRWRFLVRGVKRDESAPSA